MNFAANLLDSLLGGLAKLSQENATSFVELETVDHDRMSIVGADGSLATVIALRGNCRMVGKQEFIECQEGLIKILDSFLKDTGHTLQVYWVRDPSGSSTMVRDTQAGARAQIAALELDLKDLLDERERELSKYTAFEQVYFVCWTHPAVLSPIEGKAAKEQQRRENEVFKGMNFVGGQSPRALLSAIRNRHQSFYQSLSSELRSLGILCDVLEVHAALRAIRMSVDPEFTSPDWRACVPGDPIPVRFQLRRNETSAVWWPPLGSQVWPRDARTFERRFVQVGDRIHAPMYVDIPPVRIEDFGTLIQRTIGLDARMPWAVSFVLGGEGLRGQSLKDSIASIASVMNSDNPYIRDSLRALKVYAKSGAVIKFQVAFNTWAPVGQVDLLRQRASRLAQAFIDWGGAEVRESTGDEVEGFASTALGLTYKSIGNEAAPPLMDVMGMLPITRPASPWRTGAELFTSPDGKLMPYQPGSAMQTTWISLFLGGPGSGKSMQMFKQHIATCLAPQPGVDRLPYISIIDIGPSSSGLSSLMKNALPPHARHYVNHYRLRNTKDFCINMFDPQLGMDVPLPEERAALVDLLTMLVTPAETGTPYEGTSELVGMVIDDMYRHLQDTDRGQPHQYSENVDLVVDKALRKASIRVQENDSWYRVRDLLYRAGMPHEAGLAQRYAVPQLADAAASARRSVVMDTYGKKLTAGEGSETLPEAFSRMIVAACREYPILAGPTRFDIGESRITIFDLDEVAKGGGPAGVKQTAVMYGLSIYILTRNFTLTSENLKDFPDDYKPYHFPRVQAVAKELKTLCCDEFHRTGAGFSTMLRERIKVYGREGRKWNIQVMLGSQQLRDFDEDMITMATAIYIMERSDEGLIKQYTERFGLSETEQQAIREGVRSPRAGGATFFVRMKTKEGMYNQLLRNPAGPLELWAGSTTSEDKALRELVYGMLGPANGRMALAMSYPGGSAKEEVESRKNEMAKQGNRSVGATSGDNDLYQTLANEVVGKYQKRRDDQLRDEMAEQALRNIANPKKT